MSTGSRIAELRTTLKWSQTYLANRIGTNTKSVKDWENDVSLPTAKNLKKLSVLFSTTTDYLLEMEERPLIKLEGCSKEDENRIRAIVQAYIESSPLFPTSSED